MANGTYEAEYTIECPDCGGTMRGIGLFSDGTPIHDPHTDYTYEPRKGEMLKNIFVECSQCGDWQAS